jgi:Ferritin-like domain
MTNHDDRRTTQASKTPQTNDCISLTDIDADGALRETAERLPTRAQLLSRGARVAAFGGLALSVFAQTADAKAKSSQETAKQTRDDVAILNFALALEYLQASFYTQAERVGALHGKLAEQARVVGSHERAHVKAFKATLGHHAIKKPSFDFRGTTDNPKSFRATAVAFEDLAVGAYKEQLPKITSKQYLAAAIGISSVEARHAAWIRLLANILPAEHAFDDALPDPETVKIVNDTHFVTLQVPRTSADRAPAFTG